MQFVEGTVNTAVLVGVIDKDPRHGTTGKGYSWASVTILTKMKWFQRGGTSAVKNSWVSVTAWGKTADTFIATGAKKGDWVSVNGYLETAVKVDPSGNKNYRMNLVADVIELVGAAIDTPAPADGGDNGDQSDLPF